MYTEGCFTISISKYKNFNTIWRVRLSFTIGLHEKDKDLLK